MKKAQNRVLKIVYLSENNSKYSKEIDENIRGGKMIE